MIFSSMNKSVHVTHNVIFCQHLSLLINFLCKIFALSNFRSDNFFRDLHGVQLEMRAGMRACNWSQYAFITAA